MVFLRFRAMALVGGVLLHKGAVFTLSRFFLTANVSQGTICLALSLIGMHAAAAAAAAAAFIFLYSSFGVFRYLLNRIEFFFIVSRDIPLGGGR